MAQVLRSARRVAALMGAATGALGEYALACASRGRPGPKQAARWLHRWCRWTLPQLGVRLSHAGAIPTSGMLVANHLSYLDILAIAALQPAVFVAKREVRHWPVFGWLAILAGTIFVDRSRAADIPRVNAEIAQRLSEGLMVVVFAESTSSDGASILPFRSPLLQPAIEGAKVLTAARISYTVDGEAGRDACYWGEMVLLPHLLRLLSRRKIQAHLSFGHPRRFADRRYAAIALREQVSQLPQIGSTPTQDATMAAAASFSLAS